MNCKKAFAQETVLWDLYRSVESSHQNTTVVLEPKGFSDQFYKKIDKVPYPIVRFYSSMADFHPTSSYRLRIQLKKRPSILDEVFGSAAASISKTQGWRMRHKVYPKSPHNHIVIEMHHE